MEMTDTTDWDQPVPVEHRTFAYFVRGTKALWRLVEPDAVRFCAQVLRLGWCS